MAQGKIINQTSDTVEYMLLETTTSRNEYQSVAPNDEIILPDTYKYLVLKMPAADGFDFTEFSTRINYIPVQFRRETDSEGNDYEIFVFQYAIDDEAGLLGDGEDDGSMTTPQPPIPPAEG